MEAEAAHGRDWSALQRRRALANSWTK